MTTDFLTNLKEGQESQTRTGFAASDDKFADLASAGRNLVPLLDHYRGSSETVVIAIARGGVPVALEVATQLRLPLDVLLIRRMLAPRGPGSEVCAVNVCGTLVIDQDLPLPSATPKTPIEYFVRDALDDLALRQSMCRGERPALEVAGKKVVLVDNGIHTGSTVLAAIRALRRLQPSQIVVAVPVASYSSRAEVEAMADALVCLAWPEPFVHVGLWYSDFKVPNEEQIRRMLDRTLSPTFLSD